MNNSIKAYTIYSGNSFSKLLFRYLLLAGGLLLTELFFMLLWKDFSSIRTSFTTAVLVSPLGIFSAAICDPSENYKRKNHYFFSMKNCLEIYKNYYLVTYLAFILFIILFVIFTYTAGVILKLLSADFWIYLVSDLIIMLACFATLPFFYGSKKSGAMFGKILGVSIVFSFLGAYIQTVHWSILIPITIYAGVTFVISNRLWFKKVEKMYSEI